MDAVTKVCLAQINSTVGDLEGNRQKILDALARARESGAALVTFPELALTGYPPEDLLFQESFVADNLKMLRSLLPHTKDLAVFVGFVDRRGGRLLNSGAFLADGRQVCVYHKTQLPNYGVFDEKRYFLPGEKTAAVDLGKSMRVALSICEDIWVPESLLYRRSDADGASLLLNISASPYHAGKADLREALLKKLAKKIGSAVVYQNLVGGQDELVFDGGSMVMGPDGKLLARAASFEEDILTVDVPVRLPRKNPPNRFFSTARVSLELAQKRPARMSAVPLPLKKEEEIYKALTLGTRDYVRKNGFQKAVIGLSGGIDSALVACLAVDALGASNVIGVTMPSRYTSSGTYRDAKALAANLNVACLDIAIDGLFKNYLSVLKPFFGKRPADLAEENLQARIRGTLLMALSNKWGYLVLTTGNKSEMATGFCTLYGDMAGGFAVIKDVPKRWIFRLARYRNGLSAKKAIPESVLRRAPTAELRPHQKDRDSLPPYPALDRFLEQYVERDRSLDSIVKGGFPKPLALKLARMVDRSEYKRRQAPPGIKITPKAFGRDRRMPITNRYSF